MTGVLSPGQALKDHAVTPHVGGIDLSYLGMNPGLRAACVTDG